MGYSKTEFSTYMYPGGAGVFALSRKKMRGMGSGFRVKEKK
jgi:hypothetical protein